MTPEEEQKIKEQMAEVLRLGTEYPELEKHYAGVYWGLGWVLRNCCEATMLEVKQ